MTLITLPYRPANLDPEDISQIIADFDAVLNVVNGNIDDNNVPAGALSLNRLKSGGASPGQYMKWSGTAWAPATVPGCFLGAATYHPNPNVTNSTTSATYVDVDATNVKVDVTLAGTKMLAFASTRAAISGGNGYMALREGTNTVGSSNEILTADQPVRYTWMWEITGLTPGAHTYKLGFASNGSATLSFYYGTNASTIAWGPITLALWDLG